VGGWGGGEERREESGMVKVGLEVEEGRGERRRKEERKG